MHLQTHSITVLECISKFTQSWCGETLELEGRPPIINTPRLLKWHPKGVRGHERVWLEELRMHVKGYLGIPGHDEPHKLGASTNARQECMRPRAWNDRLCISFIEMMSIYPRVFQIYTSCCCVHLHYPCISICIHMERL